MTDAERVLARIDSRELIDFASTLVTFPSFKTEETELARWLAGWFVERGYEVELQEVEPGRFQTIATLKGSGGGQSLMFNGHIDIDPLAYGWRRDPFTPTLEGNKLYGAGVWNMKGGDTAMVMATEAIRRSGVTLKGDIVIALVVGELQGGVGTVHLCEHGPLADAAVVTEPYGAHNVITTHAGVTELAISTIGKSVHISRKPTDAWVSAIESMGKLIPAIERTTFRFTPRADLPDLPLLNVGGIVGGRGRDHDLRGPNYVSDYCTILVDVRFLPSQSSQTVVEDIRAAIDAVVADHPEIAYEIATPPPAAFRAMRTVMEPTDVPLDEAIVQSVIRHYTAVAGQPPKTIGTILPLSYGGDDTCHLWRAGVPCVLYGPDGSEGTNDEPDTYVDVDELALACQVLALTALDFCNQPASA